MKSLAVLFAFVLATAVGCGTSVTGPESNSDSASTMTPSDQTPMGVVDDGGDWYDETE